MLPKAWVSQTAQGGQVSVTWIYRVEPQHTAIGYSCLPHLSKQTVFKHWQNGLVIKIKKKETSMYLVAMNLSAN